MLKNSGAAMASAATFAAAAALCIGSAATAFADVAAPGSNTQSLGSPANIGGQAWTVTNLKQSSDAIPYQPHGTLWEATATDEAVQGGATPVVSDLNAISPSGQTYRVLYQVATPQGINPAGLAQGQKTTGKVYFDVTGDSPNAVVYRDANGQDLATWVQSTAPAGGHGATTGTGGQATSTPGNKPAASAGNATAPAGAQGTPIPVGSQGTPASGGTPAAAPVASPGAPVPAGTPAPANSPGAPAPGGAPAPAGNPDASAPGAPAPAAEPGAPAQVPGNTPPPTGSEGTPASAGSPAAPPPAPANPAPPAPGGSPSPGGDTVAPTGAPGQN